MSITAILAEIGVEASLLGAEPRSEQEYLDRVAIHSGGRPDWNDIEPRLLDMTRSLAAEAIDRAAHQAIERLRSGDAIRTMLDMEKTIEARKLLANGPGSREAFPLLSATGDDANDADLLEEARRVIELRSAYIKDAARHEANRLTARRRLRAASDFSEILRIREKGLSTFRSSS